MSPKKVVGYFGSWAGYRKGDANFDVNNINPSLYTHLVYTFLGVESNGTVKYLDPNLDLTENWGRGFIEKFIALRSKSPSTKFLMSIGGWNMGSAVFSEIAANPTARSNFARNVNSICNKHGFDGFDLDWEYPAKRDSTHESADKSNFIDLLRELKSNLNGKLLTIATSAAESSASISYDIPKVAACVDFINLMTYDLHGSWDNQTGHNAPLYSGPADKTSHQKELNVDAIVNYWLRSGCPKDKLVLGIPLYGRSFTLENSSNNGVGAPASAGIAGEFVAEQGFLAYNEICYNIKNKGWRKTWDNIQKVPYAVNGSQWVGYEDTQSIAYKLSYIKDKGLGGAMLWSIDTDDFNNFSGEGSFPLSRAAHNAL